MGKYHWSEYYSGQFDIIDDIDTRLVALEAAARPIEEDSKLRAAADTLERLRKGEAIPGSDGDLFLTNPEKCWKTIANERDAYAERNLQQFNELAAKEKEIQRIYEVQKQFAAERDALAAKVAELEEDLRATKESRDDAFRRLSAGLATDCEQRAKVADLERRLAEATKTIKTIFSWTPNQPGEWVAADVLAALRRDAERWRDIIAVWRSGAVLTAIEMLEKEAKP